MKKVFISHPFADDPIGNRRRADKLCKRIAQNEKFIPISPLHLFGFLEDDARREDIMEVCFDLMDMCEEVWVFYYDEMSNGQVREYQYAYKNDMEIRRKVLQHSIKTNRKI
jgi:hypothetical protein